MTDNLENEANASDGESISRTFVENEVSKTETPPGESNENSESVNESADTQAEAETKPEGEQETGSESEKIVTTKEEKDAEAMRIREIERRKAKRVAEQEVGAKYEAELEKIKQQQVPQQPIQQQYVPPAPSPDHIWEPSLNQWIDPNMTVNDLIQLASQTQPQAGYGQQPVNQQSAAPVQQAAQKTLPDFSEDTQNQADECVVRIKDFQEVMTGAPISREMANAAALDPQGMKNLYQMAKDAPHELYKILQLPADKQKERMWLMNQKFTAERVEKLKTKATPQATPLNNTGEVSKAESSMGVSELKRKRFAKYWDEGG